MASYKSAGVDIDEANKAVGLMKKHVKSTYNRHVLTNVGSFGGIFDCKALKGLKEPLLVSSVDGVGTKIKIASMMGKYDSVGQDLVNHCVDDILVMGAKPLFFLDYIACDKLDAKKIAAIVKGFAKACKENGVALVGGETAEMPGVYRKGETDVAGTVVGVVEKKKVLGGKKIMEGDAVIGLPSNGLHTNGYSLARKVFVKKNRINKKIGLELLRAHKSYLKPIEALRKKFDVHGLAHITGGGLLENIPRVLPKSLSVMIDGASWKVPELFLRIQKQGKVPWDDMYRTFNMGIGMVVFVPWEQADKAIAFLKKNGEKAKLIGLTVKKKGLN